MDIWLKVFTWSDEHCIQSGNYLEKRQTDWLLDFNGDRQIVELTSNQAESSLIHNQSDIPLRIQIPIRRICIHQTKIVDL